MRPLLIAIIVVSSLSFATTPSTIYAMGGGSDDEKKIGPNFVEGKKAIQEGRYKEAIAALQRSASKNPKNADIENLIGFSYRQLKDYEKAFAHYVLALKIDPKHKQAMEYMGIAYLETKNLEQAETIFGSLKKLCAFCKERRSLDKAIKTYKRAQNTGG